MNRFEPNLRIPGPTGLPPSVREAGGRQMINHRGPEFAAMLDRVMTADEAVLRDDQRHRPAVVRRHGRARGGGRQRPVARRPGPGGHDRLVRRPVREDRRRPTAPTSPSSSVEWGQAADPAEVRAALAAEPAPGYRAVLLTHNETSTGVMNPIPALAAAIREVDADALHPRRQRVRARRRPVRDGRLGHRHRRHRLAEDLDGRAGHGHGRAPPSGPGRRWRRRRCRASTSTSHAHRDSHDKGQTPFTPALAVLYQLDEGIGLMEREGAAAIFARHAACAAATRAGLRALGFELFADRRFASQTVTAAWLPEGLDWKAFNDGVKRARLVLAGGQGKLAGHDLPARPPRLGDPRRDPRRDRRHRGGLARARPRGRARSGRRRGPAGGARVASGRSGRRRPSAREDPRRRTPRRRGPRPPPRPPRGRRAARPRPRRVRGDPARLRRARRPQPGPGRCRAHRAPGSRLVVIGRAGVGVDNVDLDAATRAGIVVVNAPTGNTIAAAEHTLALLYALARRSPPADASLRRGEWKRSQFTGRRAPRPDARDRRARQDRPGDRRPGPGDGDDRPRPRSVRVRRAGRPPRHRARRAPGAPRAIRRGHGPRAAQPGDPRPHRRPPARPDEAGRDPPQRRPRRDRRRGGARRRARGRAISAAPRSTCSSTSRRPARRSSTPRTRS